MATWTVALSFDRVTQVSSLNVPHAPTRYYLHVTAGGNPVADTRIEAQIQPSLTVVSPWATYRTDSSGIARIDVASTPDTTIQAKFRAYGSSDTWSNTITVTIGGRAAAAAIDASTYLKYTPGNLYVFESTNHALTALHSPSAPPRPATGRTILQMEQEVTWGAYTITPWRFTKESEYLYWDPTGDLLTLRWMIASPSFSYVSEAGFNNYFWGVGDKRYTENASNSERDVDPDKFSSGTIYGNKSTSPYPAYLLAPKSLVLPYVFFSSSSNYSNLATDETLPPTTLAQADGSIYWSVRAEMDTVAISGVYTGAVLRVDYFEGAASQLDQAGGAMLRESWYFAPNIGLVQILVRYFNGAADVDSGILAPTIESTSDGTADTIVSPDVSVVLEQYFDNPVLDVSVSTDNVTYRSTITAVETSGYYLKVNNVNYTGYLEAKVGSRVTKWLWVEDGLVFVSASTLTAMQAASYSARFRPWVPNETFNGETRVNPVNIAWSNEITVNLTIPPPYPYYPPKSLTKTQTQIIRELDPDWRPPNTSKDTEFVFSNGRIFSGTPSQRGPYEDS